MALVDLLKTFKNEKEEGLLQEIDRYLMYRDGADIGRSYEVRAEGYHHPSVLASFDCLRQYVYSWIDAKRSNPSINAKGKRIFHTGNDFGYRIQGYLYEMGILIGEWLCTACEYRWMDLDDPSPNYCPKCGRELEIWYNLHYLEIPLLDDEEKMAGKADAGVLREGKKTLWEFKTIKNRDQRTSSYANTYEDLVQPLDHHNTQFNLYMYLANKLYGKNKDDFTSGGFVYISKNTQDWKEFNLTLMDEVIQKAKVKRDLVEQHVADKTLPERAGMDKTDRFCRFCQWLDLCWTSGHTFSSVDRRVMDE